MGKTVTITKTFERRTYLKGWFEGKFSGKLDYVKSDERHENFYDLEIIDGEINTSKDNLRRWEEGGFEEFKNTELFLTKMPESIRLVVNENGGIASYYHVQIHEAKLTKYSLSKQVYDGDRIFGDIQGELVGYLIHFDEEHEEVPVIEEDFKFNFTDHVEEQEEVKETKKRTGRNEVDGDHIRYEYYNTDGSTYWGKWVKSNRHRKRDQSILSSLSFVFQALVGLLFLLPLLLVGWKVILFLAVLAGIVYLLSLIGPILAPILNWGLRLVTIGFVLLFGFNIISLLTKSDPVIVPRPDPVVVNPENPEDQIEIAQDTIISHFRNWEGYGSENYSGILSVLTTDYVASKNHRNGIRASMVDTDFYNQVVSQIHQYDRIHLNLIYDMFEELRATHYLDEMKFAEAIVSCVQDIPYTLILPYECDPYLYGDEFVTQYLAEGRPCAGSQRFGLLSPTEFVGTLDGDCDTRTLLLFTILDHFGYDVAMLGSEYYGHSIIGIDLPYFGLSKTINGKRYVLWETTSRGIPPGVIGEDMADLRFWDVSLISNNSVL